MDKLGVLVSLFQDLQKTRIASANRARTIEDPDLHLLIGQVRMLEKDVIRDVRKEVRNHPLWDFWLKNIPGVGEVLAGQLIHSIRGQVHTVECQQRRAAYFSKKEPGEKRPRTFMCDCQMKEIERFPNVSSLWKYAGLHVVSGRAPKPKRGEKIDYSPKLRTLCWNIVKSCMMHEDSPYAKWYREFKAEEVRKHPELRPGHLDLRARRKTAKLFLAHLFNKWYELKGLEPPKPYPLSMLGHAGYIPPPE
jgi:hypothetical protein